jgi:crotonobetainyl-CoA:carnitine CoA-transferase CaiB-like acyl-CoA transferase
MEKWGLGYDALSAANPGLVMLRISGYGQDGPYRDRAGHDLNYIAIGGALAMTGPRGGAPQMPGVQLADLAGGGLWGATGVLAALVGRGASGQGRHLDISMTEGALALLSAELGNVDCGAHPTRGMANLNGGLACYNIYRTKDARYLAVGALEPKFWLALNAAVGRQTTVAELIPEAPIQAKARAELAAIFATRTAAEWTAALASSDCCVELVTEMDELADHPLHQAREVFFTLDAGPGIGAVRQARTPLGAPSSPRRPPLQGENTREVLAEYGFADAEITALM